MCRAELGGCTVDRLCVQPADGSLINAEVLRAKKVELDTRHRRGPKCVSLDKRQLGQQTLTDEQSCSGPASPVKGQQ